MKKLLILIVSSVYISLIPAPIELTFSPLSPISSSQGRYYTTCLVCGHLAYARTLNLMYRELVAHRCTLEEDEENIEALQPEE